MDPRLEHPFTCLVAGPTMCGKTELVKKLVETLPQSIKLPKSPPIEDIIWCYGEWQPSYESLEQHGVRFVQGVLNSEDLNPNIPHLVILDDLMDQTDKRICQFFTRGCHHRNASVIYIVQNLFNGHKDHRTISLNCQYMILFKNPRDCRQIKYLANQMFHKDGQCMTEGFNDATNEAYGYLLVDLKQDTPTCMRLRSKNFDTHPVVYVPKGIKIDSQYLPPHSQTICRS